MSWRIKSVVTFIILLVIVVVGIMFILHFRNQLPIQAIRTDIATGALLPTVSPSEVLKSIKNIADTYKFDPVSKTGVEIVIGTKDTILITGTLLSYSDVVTQDASGSVEIQTSSGVLDAILTNQTIYTSLSDSAVNLSSVKALSSIREIDKNSKVRVEAQQHSDGKMYVIYVEKRT